MLHRDNYVLINIGFAEHHADWNYKQVVSPFTRIYMPVKGSAMIHLPEGSYEVEPGYLYIIPAYCMHHYECNDDFSLYYIHLYEGDGNNLGISENYNFQHKIPAEPIDRSAIEYLFDSNPNRNLRSYNPQQYNDHTTFVSDINSSVHEPLYRQLESESLLKLLMSHFLKYATSKTKGLDTRVSRALLYIRSNLSRSIEIGELAKLSCVSTEHFTRIFTEQVGESPIKYICLKRIQRAQLLLILNDTQIKDVAFAVGYNDISYFNRVFKRLVGCTPQHYRSQYFNIS